MRKQLDPRLKRITEGLMWEHASVSPTKGDRIPTWEEMSFIKSLLWEEEETVIQYHPAKSRYVNNHPYVLHLWRPINEVLPLPPVYMVGVPGVRVRGVIPAKGGHFVITEKENNEPTN